MRFKYYISPLILQLLLRLLLYPVALFFLHGRIKGLENLRGKNSNFILAANHISEIDSGLIPSLVPIWAFIGPIFFTSLDKKGYSHKGLRGKIFYGGFLFHLLGARRVYRKKDNYRLAVKNHIKLLEEGESILIFPEGRASRDGNISKTGGGTSYLLYRTRKPITPIKLEGVWNMSFKEFITRKRFFTMTIGKPIYYEDLFDEFFVENKENFKKISDEILRRIINL